MKLVKSAFMKFEDPVDLFSQWYAAAERSEINDANAMALATCGGKGEVDVRIVLLKGFDGAGFRFYSNTQSAKGRALAENPNAALGFHWKALGRQVRIRGNVEAVSAEQADAYFSSRARRSQIGAWASEQSRSLDSHDTLMERIKIVEQRFAGHEVPRPPHWSGWNLIPFEIEFWQSQPARLHDRLVFCRESSQGEWRKNGLFP